MTPDSETLDDAVEEAVEGTIGEQLVQVVQADGPEESGMIRPFLVIDLRSALRSFRQTDAPVIGEAAEAASDLTSEGQLTGQGGSDQQSADSGRGILSSLFLAGVIVGVGYALRNRRQQEAPDEMAEEAAEEAADQTQTIAEKAAATIQQRGEVAATRIEESTGAIAERIEEGGDQAAEQIQEGGEQAADQIDEASDQLEDVEEEAEDKMEEAEEEAEDMADEASDDENEF